MGWLGDIGGGKVVRTVGGRLYNINLCYYMFILIS